MESRNKIQKFSVKQAAEKGMRFVILLKETLGNCTTGVELIYRKSYNIPLIITSTTEGITLENFPFINLKIHKHRDHGFPHKSKIIHELFTFFPKFVIQFTVSMSKGSTVSNGVRAMRRGISLVIIVKLYKLQIMSIVKVYPSSNIIPS